MHIGFVQRDKPLLPAHPLGAFQALGDGVVKEILLDLPGPVLVLSWELLFVIVIHSFLLIWICGR